MATLIYARVSKPEQNLDHQRENLWEYATDELGIDGSEIDVLEDKSTGTNTDRSGYRTMLERVRDDEADRVIVREVTRLGRTMRDISENVHEMVQDHDCGLYVMNDPIEVDPGDELTMHDKMLLNVLAWAAELEAKKIRENTIEGLRAAEAAGKWTTRPPYGFTTDEDGYLQPTEDFSKAVRAIRAVEEEGWSHRKAARHTGVPRRTVPNLLEREELYLDEHTAPRGEG
jgi:DNA invertase Pin-like site-specific DNA recombinase